MYPNPLVADQSELSICLTHASNEATEFSILTEGGLKVAEGVTTDDIHKINLKELKKGLYFVRVKNAHTHSTQKLVVK